MLFLRKNVAQQNGGIEDINVFEENEEDDRRVIAVNLNNATNKYRNRRFYAAHSYDFGRSFFKVVDSVEKRFFMPLYRLQHHVQVQRQSFVYEDIPSDFLLNYFLRFY